MIEFEAQIILQCIKCKNKDTMWVVLHFIKQLGKEVKRNRVSQYCLSCERNQPHRIYGIEHKSHERLKFNQILDKIEGRTP